jgi:hypothetical protein
MLTTQVSDSKPKLSRKLSVGPADSSRELAPGVFPVTLVIYTGILYRGVAFMNSLSKFGSLTTRSTASTDAGDPNALRQGLPNSSLWICLLVRIELFFRVKPFLYGQ